MKYTLKQLGLALLLFTTACDARNLLGTEKAGWQQALEDQAEKPKPKVKDTDIDAALLKVADINLAAGNFDSAEANYNDILAKHPDSAEATYGLARVHLFRKEFVKSVELTDKAIALRDDPKFHAFKGIIQDTQNDHKGAQKIYNDALRTHPGSVILRNNLGMSYIVSGQFPLAVQIFEALNKLPSADAKTRANLALAYGVDDETDKAKEMLSGDMTPEQIDHNLQVYADMRRKYTPAAGL